MRSLLRGKRTGLIAFGFICALVVGGLGWVTHAALCLEQEQAETRAAAEHAEKRRLWQREHEHQAELQRRERQQSEAEAQSTFAARLRLALWRLDSRITPALAREDTRPYSHYSAIFAPSVILDDKGTAYDEAQVFEPSPLLNADLLHALRAMGHGDEIAIVDANFPATTMARRLIRMDGVSATRAAEAILSVLPLDDFVDRPAIRMQVVGDAKSVPAVCREFRALACRRVPAKFDDQLRAMNADGGIGRDFTRRRTQQQIPAGGIAHRAPGCEPGRNFTRNT